MNLEKMQGTIAMHDD